MRRLVALPTSSTGTVGYVSLRALELLGRIRKECGGSCYLVSGARTSTLAQRAPYFSHRGEAVIDGYSSESGGRLFVGPDFVEDVTFGRRHDVTAMNNLKAQLRDEDGLVIDDQDYTHQFRLRRSKQPNEVRKCRLMKELHHLLAREMRGYIYCGDATV